MNTNYQVINKTNKTVDNDGKNIKFKSDYSNFEVIVIDDCSSSPIDDIQETFPMKFIQLEKNKGNGFARNIGVKNSTKDVLFFIDADTEMPNNVFHLINQGINVEGNDGVCGVVHEKSINRGIVSEWIAYETNYILKKFHLIVLKGQPS